MSNAVIAGFLIVFAALIAQNVILFLKVNELTTYTSSLNNNVGTSFGKLVEAYTALQKSVETYKEIAEKQNKVCSELNNNYKKILEGNQKLYGYWEDIAERYSDAYEEFRECSERLTALKDSIEELRKETKKNEVTIKPIDFKDLPQMPKMMDFYYATQKEGEA